MPPIHVDVLICITLYSCAVFLVGWRFLTSRIQRTMYAFNIVGFYWYSGVGAAYEGVRWDYVLSYLVSLLCIATAFVVTLIAFAPTRARIARRVRTGVERVVKAKLFVPGVIGLYCVFLLLLAVGPDLDVNRLLAPQMPDVATMLQTKFLEGRVPPLSARLLEYGALLTFPFYLVALWRLQRRPLWLGLWLFLPLYFRYCEENYIGRYPVLLALTLYLYYLWFAKRRWRILIVAGVVVSGPLLAKAAYQYQAVRLGVSASDIRWAEAVTELAVTETSFPLHSSTVVDRELRIDLWGYWAWLATLPLPKVLVGEIQGARTINYDLSEEISGIKMGRPGSNVILYGLVTESIYIYGTMLFFVHLLGLGFVFGLLCNILESHSAFTLLVIYTALLYGYSLNRGGIASVVGTISSSYMFFYVWLAFIYYQGHGRHLIGRQVRAAPGVPLRSRDGELSQQ
jgi:hypothetical protein